MRNRYGKFLIGKIPIVLIFTLIISTMQLISSNHVSASNETNAARIVYHFSNLFPGYPVQPGWKLIGKPKDVGVPEIKPASYGALIDAKSLNQFRKFEFEVPSDGYYLLEFSGFQTFGGAIASISVDDAPVGQYSFYNMGGDGPVKPLKTVHLNKGSHVLELKNSTRDPRSTSFYMFPTQFILTEMPGPPILEAISLSVSKPKLLINEAATYEVSGKMSDRTDADLSKASVTVVSSNPSVVDIVDGKLVAKQEGASQLTATAQLDGVVQLSQVNVQVFAKRMLESVSLSLNNGRSVPLLLMGKSNPIIIKTETNDGVPADMTVSTVVYSSSSPSVATIDASGLVTPVAPGESTVSATVTVGGVARQGSLKISVEPGKSRSTYFTPAKVAAARKNVDIFDWAKLQRDTSVALADKYVDHGLEKIWNVVSSPTLPRSYAVNQKVGSPVTGKEIDKYGNYPYQADPFNEPWKLVDPSSGYKFPTNDFGAYYKSGLDEKDIFRPERADRSLLVNTLYPEKGPNWGVDDGFGWVDEKGNRFTFIAYYNHWFIWSSGYVNTAFRSLRDAYVFTGDPKYARVGTVLLDRIADVYPDMDIAKFNQSQFLNNHGGTFKGKLVGSIWETADIRVMLEAYDAFFPGMNDPETISFLSEKAARYGLPGKSSADAIRRNIEDGLVRQVYPGVKNAQIRGNTGTHQSTLAMAAVVYDTFPETKEWLDFDFQPGALISDPYRVTGGNIFNMLVNDVDRDGQGNEASPFYNKIWVDYNRITADILNGYDKYPAADLYKNVKYRKMFTNMYPFMMAEKYIAQIGDTGATGNPGLSLDLTQNIRAFEIYRDPVFAQIAYFLNNNSTEGIHLDVFSENPIQIKQDIENVIREHGPLDLKSMYMGGYGFTALRDGKNGIFNYGIRQPFTVLPVVDKSKDIKPLPSSAAIEFGATAVGDRITFSFDVPKTDTYEISVKPLRNVGYGIYDVQIDGTTTKSIDFFGGLTDHEAVAAQELTAGTHQITFVATGKFDASSGYKLGLIELALLDKKEQKRKDKTLADNTLRDMWIYYGRNGAHGHRDTLNLGIHAFGLDVAPDLGYPEVADTISSHRHEWVRNTISHNTVVVDKSMQSEQIVSVPSKFEDGERVKLFEAEAPKVYPQTELYRRTTAMIKVDEANSYYVDFFRVKGGNDHVYSFHSAEGSVATEGLELVPQATGTYAGPDVEYGVTKEQNVGTGFGYTGNGFHFLKNVERDQAPNSVFSVDWDIKDTYKVIQPDKDVHLRLTMLTDVNDMALADGIPPTNKVGNPKSIKYMLAHRTGTDLNSLFTSVIEPYESNRIVQSIEAVPLSFAGTDVDPNESKAVKVTLANGRTDYIVSTLHPDREYLVDKKYRFKGSFAVISEEKGKVDNLYMNEGEYISSEKGKNELSGTPSVTGKVIDFTKELSVQNEIVVEADLKGLGTESLVGRLIRVDSDEVRNASYKILGVRSLGENRYALDIGDITPIRSYVDAKDFSKGFKYDLADGKSFHIALPAENSGKGKEHKTDHSN